MGDDAKPNGWDELVGDQLPEIIGAFIVTVVILGIPTLCWKTLRWNWQRPTESRFRKTLFFVPSAIGVLWIAVAALSVIITAEKHYELDIGVGATTAKLAEALPNQVGNFVEWLQSTAVAIPWWLIIFLIALALVVAVLNQRFWSWTKSLLSLFTRTSTDSPEHEVDGVSNEAPTPQEHLEVAEGQEEEAATTLPAEQNVSFYGVQWTRTTGSDLVPFCPRCNRQMAVANTPRRGMAFAGPGMGTAHLQCPSNTCQQPNIPLNMRANAVQREVTRHFEQQRGD